MKNEFYIKVDFNKIGEVNLKDIPLVKSNTSGKNSCIICGGLVKNNALTLIFKVNNVEDLEMFNNSYENKLCKYEITKYSPRLLPTC